MLISCVQCLVCLSAVKNYPNAEIRCHTIKAHIANRQDDRQVLEAKVRGHRGNQEATMDHNTYRHQYYHGSRDDRCFCQLEQTGDIGAAGAFLHHNNDPRKS